MTLDISVPEQQEIFLSTPKITVIGVGGAGGNAINNMIHTKLSGVNFVVGNTDAQALASSLAEKKIQLGVEATKGQGAGANPDVGRESAEEAVDDIASVLEGSNMVFITAGMGGGTGTGAAPVFAKMARDRQILTVGVVTKPFTFEGRHRMAIAERGIEELAQHVDTLIVIPNQNLFYIADDKMTLAEAFKKADQVLQDGVRSITDLIITPGIINLDFSDVRTVMTDMGRAMMGTGESSEENRAIRAAEEAISNPLLDDASMAGAQGILINIAGGSDLTLFEVDEATNRIRKEVDQEANIIFGASYDEKLEGSVRVSVVATGISRSNDAQNLFMTKPSTSSIFAQTTQSTQPKTYPTTFNKPVVKPAVEVPTSTLAPKPVQETHVVSKEAEAYEYENEEAVEEIEAKQEDVLDIPPPPSSPAPTLIQPTPTQTPYTPKTTSSILPAMPSANELFGGETRQAVAFEAFTPKLPEPKIQMPEINEPVRHTHMPEPIVRPAPVEMPHPQAQQQPKTAQEDLFAPPPSLPPAVKPAEKSRHSLFQFVTGRRATEAEKENTMEQNDFAEEESDIPAFLRQK